MSGLGSSQDSLSARSRCRPQDLPPLVDCPQLQHRFPTVVAFVYRHAYTSTFSHRYKELYQLADASPTQLLPRSEPSSCAGFMLHGSWSEINQQPMPASAVPGQRSQHSGATGLALS